MTERAISPTDGRLTDPLTAVGRPDRRRSAPTVRVRAAARLGAALLPVAGISVLVVHALVTGPASAGFGPIESLQVVPVYLWALVVLSVAYRDVLATEIMNRRRTESGLIEHTGFGWGVRWAPVLLSWSVPLIFATSVLGAAVAVAVALVGEIAGLEWFRRRRALVGVGQLRWSDPHLEAYRLRWDTAAFSVALVAGGMLAGAIHYEGGHDPGNLAAIALIGAMLIVGTAYMRVFDAFQKDDALTKAFSTNALAGAGFGIGPVYGARHLSSNLPLALGISAAGAVAFVLSAEWHRRRAIAIHVRQLKHQGFAEQILAMYGARVAVSGTAGDR